MTQVLAVKIDSLTYAEVLARIEAYLDCPQNHLITTINPEFVVAAQTDKSFLRILNDADLRVPDGVGVLMALAYQKRMAAVTATGWRRGVIAFGQGLAVGLGHLFDSSYLEVDRRRVTGADLTVDICRLCQEKDQPAAILVAAGGLTRAKEVSDHLRTRFPRLSLTVLETSLRQRVTGDLIKHLAAKEWGALLISFPQVVQEKWLAANLPRLRARVAMGVGGSFDFLVGRVPRAPRRWRQRGWEWVYRLKRQPRRRLRRIINAVIVFPWLVFRDSLQAPLD